MVATPETYCPFSFAKLTDPFVEELSTRLRGRRVLEVFAGNGRLAGALAHRGVDVRATSLRSSHDGHAHGLLHPVEELDAVAAVRRYGGEAEVLLMSWPTVTEAAAVAALEWGDERPIAWIGEITLFDSGMAGLGGCATDLFHKITRIEEGISAYIGKGPLDRAAFLSVRPECVARWREGSRDPEAIAAPDGAAWPFR